MAVPKALLPGRMQFAARDSLEMTHIFIGLQQA